MSGTPKKSIREKGRIALEPPLEDGAAYHVVVNALEGKSGWTPTARFASAIWHAMSGHLPHHRYRDAGRARRRDGVREGEVERAVFEWLEADLNPAIHFMRSLTSRAAAFACYNAYNEAVELGVRTKASSHAGSGIVVRREVLGAFEDLEPCRLGTVAVLNAQIAAIGLSEAQGFAPKPKTLSSVAAMLGVAGSAGHDVSMALEMEGCLSVAELAARLGCRQRTLQRRLRQEGLTAEGLRHAWRMVSATDRLRSPASLTEIAFELGFSDLAHMTRAFRSSCGMAPSQLRKLAYMDMATAA